MTFGELQTEVFRRLEESGSNPAFWSEAEVQQAINDGWEELALHTEWFRAEYMFQSQSDITYYDLRDYSPLEVIRVRAIWNEALERWLIPTSTKLLEQKYRRWEASGQAIDEFFLRGNFMLGIFGKQLWGDEAFTADFLTVLCTAVPPPLLPSDYAIPHPEEFCEAEILYAIYDLKAQEGETEQAMDFWKRYMLKADEMKAWAIRTVDEAIVRGFRDHS